MHLSALLVASLALSSLSGCSRAPATASTSEAQKAAAVPEGGTARNERPERDGEGFDGGGKAPRRGGGRPPREQGPTGETYPAPAGGPVVGVNFLVLGEETDTGLQPRSLSVADTEAEFQALGVQRFRQLTTSDLSWKSVQPGGGQFKFTRADEIFPKFSARALPTLFEMQYASGNPPWRSRAQDPFEKGVGKEAMDYVVAVVSRYRDHVSYWEIGNEMDHWRSADPDDEAKAGGAKAGAAAQQRTKQPANAPTGGFSPVEQGRFFAAVAKVIRANDPDARIVLPGMARLNSYTLEEWLPGVIEGAGTDTFDVVNYHFYSAWEQYPVARAQLASKLTELGLAQKEVWLTETGATSDPTLTQRTNYPNSEEQQAADVFRRFSLAYGYGDDLVLWHTFVESDGAQNNWRSYGLLRAGTKERKPSWYAFRMFTQEVLPFTAATVLEAGPARFVVRFDRAGGTRWVVWGSGDFSAPPEASRQTSVVHGGDADWKPVTGVATLSDLPRLYATPK